MLIQFLVLSCVCAVIAYERPMNEIGLGSYRITNETDPGIITALNHPLYTNNLSFQGFNVTKPLGAVFSGTLNSDHDWRLQLNFSEGFLINDNQAKQVELYTYGLDFSSEDYPNNSFPLNISDWQICTSIITADFTQKVLNTIGSNDNGSCVPYFGQSCTEAWLKAYNQAPLDRSTGCRTAPLASSIDECKSIISDSNSGSYSSAITNVTEPGLVYYDSNNSYVNPQTGAVYTAGNVPTQGLASGQTFAYQQVVLDNSSTTSQDAQKLQVVGLAIVPNPSRVSGGYGYAPESRLLCGRAKALTSTSDGSTIRKISDWKGLLAISAVLYYLSA